MGMWFVGGIGVRIGTVAAITSIVLTSRSFRQVLSMSTNKHRHTSRV